MVRTIAPPRLCGPLDQIGNLLTTTQAAARCGLTERSLSTYWRNGTGPVRTRVGGKVFVAEQALADWLTALREPQSPAKTRPMPPAASAAAA